VAGIPIVMLLCWAAAVGYFDLRYRRIPNALSLGAVAAAVVWLSLCHKSLTGAPVSSALQAAGVSLLLTLPAYALKRLGAGDVKYLTALGLLTSLPITLNTFVIGALCGGMVSLIWLVAPPLLSGMQQLGACSARWALRAAKPLKMRRMPFGTLLTIGLFGSLWLSRQSS
jgi:prepilin peptidase CpaA